MAHQAKQVGHQGGFYLSRCGQLVGECERETSRRWRWRVYLAPADVTRLFLRRITFREDPPSKPLATGHAPRLRDARRACLKAMEKQVG